MRPVALTGRVFCRGGLADEIAYNSRYMFCTTCGADNKDSATFCRKCGAALSEEEETRVGRRAVDLEPTDISAVVPHEDSHEDEIFAISPTLMFVKAGYIAAVVAALVVVAIVGSFTSWSPWIAVVIGFLLLLIPAYYHVQKKLVSYRLTESQLEIDEGLVSRTTRNIPIRRIQDVTVRATAMQRLLGFGDLLIDNASDEGGKLALKNIDSPKQYADLLLRQMRRLER